VTDCVLQGCVCDGDDGPYSIAWPFFMLMSAPSQTGKTYFVYQLILKCQKKIHPPIQRVAYVYNHYQPLFDTMKKESPVPIDFMESLDLVPTDKTGHTLLIVDDLMDNADVEKQMVAWAIKRTHHENTSVCYICHNTFNATKEHRTISLNSSYLWLGKNPRSADQIIYIYIHALVCQGHLSCHYHNYRFVCAV